MRGRQVWLNLSSHTLRLCLRRLLLRNRNRKPLPLFWNNRCRPQPCQCRWWIRWGLGRFHPHHPRSSHLFSLSQPGLIPYPQGMFLLPQCRGTLPAPTWIPVTAPVWPAGGQQALPELLERISGRRSAIGSAEINELLKPGVVAGDELSSVGLAAKHAARESCSSDSNPVLPEAAGGPGFWLQVNAELVVYGATDPSARVTIGGHPIRLRPDGSFSYRFALPDGAYELPIVAVAAHGDERSAAMRFSRGTEYSGEVGAHPQCASLKPPVPDSVQ